MHGQRREQREDGRSHASSGPDAEISDRSAVQHQSESNEPRSGKKPQREPVGRDRGQELAENHSGEIAGNPDQQLGGDDHEETVENNVNGDPQVDLGPVHVRPPRESAHRERRRAPAGR